MTHGSRRRFRLAALAAVVPAALLGLSLVVPAAGAATAGGRPHPVVLSPEQFDISITLSSTDVEAFGPVAVHGGTDQTVSPTRDVFSDGSGDTVKVDHAGLPLPVIDLATCSLLFVQQDAPWRFDGGTGIWAGATGHGVFDLVGLVSFKEWRGQCWALKFVSPARALWDIDHQTGLPQPVLADFSVQAAGFAKVRPFCINHFAPTGAPSGAPDWSPSPESTCPPV
jgi:hypothetical protein